MRGTSTAAVFLTFLVASGTAAAQSAQGERWPDGEEIERFLREAKITERKKIGEGVTNPEKVTLELDGVVRNAIFKKVDKDHDSWRNEVAAYELDKIIGLGMVPPTVPRSIKGRKGCLQLWVTGVTMSKWEGTFPDEDAWREQVSIMWLWDDLIANIDRHLNNAMISPEHRLMLIDNSKTFRYQKTLLNDLNSAGTGTHARFWGVEYDMNRERFPTHYPRDLIERLKAVSADAMEDAIKPYVWGQNRKQVAERRDLILKRIDSMGLEAFRRAGPNAPPPRLQEPR
jgi:hypothetical protein